jgi:hypothetical protein
MRLEANAVAGERSSDEQACVDELVAPTRSVSEKLLLALQSRFIFESVYTLDTRLEKMARFS